MTIRRAVVCGIICGTLTCGGWSPRETVVCGQEPGPGTDEISVRGDADFSARVRGALALLKERASDDYRVIRAYVPMIVQAQRSGIAAHLKTPIFFLNKHTAMRSATWCAGMIAHEACHMKLKSSGREYAGRNAELSCMAYQTEVMKKLGAPSAETDRITSQDGSHYDVDKDGDYDWDDYRKRTW